jgi:PrcB C-terminal
MKTIILFALPLLIFTSCKKEECTPTEFDIQEIHKSALYGDGDENIQEENMVIRTQAEWDDLIDKMDSVNDESSQFSTTDVDFTQQIIIACFDQIRPNGGYGISIDEVTLSGNQVNVTVTKTDASAGGGMTTQVINQPYEIIAVNVCDEVVMFN